MRRVGARGGLFFFFFGGERGKEILSEQEKRGVPSLPTGNRRKERSFSEDSIESHNREERGPVVRAHTENKKVSEEKEFRSAPKGRSLKKRKRNREKPGPRTSTSEPTNFLWGEASEKKEKNSEGGEKAYKVREGTRSP